MHAFRYLAMVASVFLASGCGGSVKHSASRTSAASGLTASTASSTRTVAVSNDLASVALACERYGASSLLPGSNGQDNSAVPDNTPTVCGCWTHWMQDNLSPADQATLVISIKQLEVGTAIQADSTDLPLIEKLGPSLQSCDLGQTPSAISSPAAPTTTSTPTTPIATNSGPLATLQSYWGSIGAHDFSAAYADLVPGSVGLTESQFVVGEQQSGVQSASFSGHVSSNRGSVATVDVDSLITHDRQFGCRTWAGSYQLSHRSGRWLIARASISPSSCG